MRFAPKPQKWPVRLVLLALVASAGLTAPARAAAAPAAAASPPRRPHRDAWFARVRRGQSRDLIYPNPPTASSSISSNGRREQRRRPNIGSASPPAPGHSWHPPVLPTTVPVTVAALSPTRLIKFALLSVAASEVLSYVGVFDSADGFGDDDEEGEDGTRKRRRRESLAGRRAREFATRHGWDRRARILRDEACGEYERARRGIGVWWEGARRPGGIMHGPTWTDRIHGLVDREGGGVFVGFREDVVDPMMGKYRCMPDKAKFAWGTALGMVASRPVSYLSVRTVRLAALAWIGSEITHSLGWTGRARRVEDFVDTKPIRRFASETDLEEEVDGAIRFVDRTLRDVDETIRDAATGRGIDQGSRRGIGRSVGRWVDLKVEGYRRGVRRAMLHPEEGLGRLADVVEENASALSGIALGAVAGRII